MADTPLLEIKSIQRSVSGRILWSNISFEVYPGEIWFVRGPSGIGKTLLLRAISCLDPLEAGCLQLRNQSPSQVGMTCWRAQVMYVHQSRVNFKGTPNDFLSMVQNFCSQRGRPSGDLAACVRDLGLDPSMLDQQWSELSGGQAQRVSLAICLCLKPKVLLLDEPTSACDHDAAVRVEAALKQCSAAVIWVTHDNQQPLRVGGKVLELPSGSVTSISPVTTSSSSLHGGDGGGSSSSLGDVHGSSRGQACAGGSSKGSLSAAGNESAARSVC